MPSEDGRPADGGSTGPEGGDREPGVRLEPGSSAAALPSPLRGGAGRGGRGVGAWTVREVARHGPGQACLPLRPRLLADLDRDGPLLAVAVDRDVDGLAWGRVGDLAREVPRFLDGLAVDRDDGVAGLDPRLRGRAVLEGLREERAAGIVEADR